MEELGQGTSTGCLIGDVLKTGGGKVGEENVAAAGGLPANILREVADGEIDRVGGLAAEQGQLRLVRRDDDRDDGCARVALLELFLHTQMSVSLSKHEPSRRLRPELTTTIARCAYRSIHVWYDRNPRSGVQA